MALVKSWQRLVWIGIIAGLICASLLPLSGVEAGSPRQVVDPLQRAKILLTRMTPEEKVGQLFLVTFRGRDVTSKDAKILDLIKNRNVGGVMLRAANDNFTGPQGTLEEVYRITSLLQKARSDVSQTVVQNAFGYS
jgi:beta-N-acetylhexosaminidase